MFITKENGILTIHTNTLLMKLMNNKCFVKTILSQASCVFVTYKNSLAESFILLVQNPGEWNK
jgi:hypothetical protein